MGGRARSAYIRGRVSEIAPTKVGRMGTSSPDSSEENERTRTLLSAPHVASLQRLCLSVLSASSRSCAAALVRAEGLDEDAGEGARG